MKPGHDDSSGRAAPAPSGAGADFGPDLAMPRKISDIPGLGPIRVRALFKAGFSELVGLRNATLDSLLAVPGLTEIKARHIQQFLAGFSLDELRSADEVAAVPAQSDHGAANTALARPEGAGAVPPSDVRSEKVSQIVAGAVRVLGEVVQLLLSSEAPQFRTRLLRALGVLAQRAELLAIDASYLAEENHDRALRRLRRASKSLAEFAGASHADKKAQGRLADDLELLNDKLAECRLTGKDAPGKS